jgi:hypothetical protein
VAQAVPPAIRGTQLGTAVAPREAASERRSKEVDERGLAADERRLTQIENKEFIRVHRRLKLGFSASCKIY